MTRHHKRRFIWRDKCDETPKLLHHHWLQEKVVAETTVLVLSTAPACDEDKLYLCLLSVSMFFGFIDINMSHCHDRWVGHCPNMTSTVPFVAKLSYGEGRHQLFLWLRSGEVELGWHQYFNARDVYTPHLTLHNSTPIAIYVSINISLSKEKNIRCTTCSSWKGSACKLTEHPMVKFFVRNWKVLTLCRFALFLVACFMCSFSRSRLIEWDLSLKWSRLIESDLSLSLSLATSTLYMSWQKLGHE